MNRAQLAAELARSIAALAAASGLDWQSALAAYAAVAGATLAAAKAGDPQKAQLLAEVHRAEVLRHYYLNAPQVPRFEVILRRLNCN